MTTCKTNFTEADNDLAYKLNQSLSTAGVTCEDMDQGTNIINYDGKSCSTESMKSCVVGAHDGKVDASELFEFALDRYEKYQKIIEGVTGRKLPWVLDDNDPATTFDADVRAKVQGAIDKLKDILKTNGVKEGSEEYKEKLAVGLFYLAELPDTDRIQKDEKLFKADSKELFEVGLGEYWEYLKDNGGGLRIKNNDLDEYTALEALKQKQGNCTENSKVLFAIYKLAGLTPSFVHVKRDGIKSSYASVQEFINKMPAKMDHMCIGLFISGRIRFFDTSLLDSHATHDKFYQLAPRQSLSYFLVSAGAAATEKGDWDKVIAYDNEALKIDSRNAMAYYNSGIAWSKKGDQAKAIAEYTNALKFNSEFADAYNERGFAWLQKGAWDRAILDYTDMLRLNPGSADAHLMRGIALAQKKEWDNAIVDYSAALKIDSKLSMAYSNRGLAWLKKGDFEKAIADFTEDRKLTSRPEAYLNLATAFVLSGKLNNAIENFAEFFKIDARAGNHAPIYKRLVDALHSRLEKDPTTKKIAEAFAQETGGLNTSEFSAQFILAYSLWLANGQNNKSANTLELICNNLIFKDKPSQSTKDFFTEMFRLMPPDMAKDKQIVPLVESIKAKLT